MIKRILKIWFTIAYYKYKQDEVDQAPKDFNEYDHIHLNDEVSK
ncbi:transcriptional regulator [Staphylococcus haemolyticus]|nr:transcriptional regulator [Staphylococcus haemolyticus]MBD3927647.1 transcriptional regulator [Staphylococcus haemolyticus]